MLNNFKNEDFERFLKGSADGLRMRPSDGVWDKINQRMNRRRRGVVITSAIFLITASLFGYYLVDSAKSITDPMATSNIIQERPVKAAIPFSNDNLNNTNTTRPTTATSNNVTRNVATPSTPDRFNNLLMPALVAALPLFDPLNTTALLTQFEGGENMVEGTIVDEYEPNTNTAQVAATENKVVKKGEYPYTIESVVNLYKRQFKSPKTGLQRYE